MCYSQNTPLAFIGMCSLYLSVPLFPERLLCLGCSGTESHSMAEHRGLSSLLHACSKLLLFHAWVIPAARWSIGQPVRMEVSKARGEDGPKGPLVVL